MKGKSMSEYDPESDFRIDWDENAEGGVVIAKYIGSKKEVRIPPNIQNFPVTGIGDDAFADNKNITDITIPNGVTSIGFFAFSDCTCLNSITIPNSVAKIGYAVFEDCTSLTAINVDSDNTAYSSDNGVLFNKTKTSLIKYPAGKTGSSFDIPNGVTSIEEHSFYCCASLTCITIPDSVNCIGERAFSGCAGLAGVTIPGGVTSIGSTAFSGCFNLTAINVAADNNAYTAVDDVLYNKDKTSLHTYPAGKTSSTFIIPDSVTTIGEHAFYYCACLTDIAIPKGVTSIGEWAFSGCAGLTSIDLPDCIIGIGNGVFADCINLTSVNIPNSVTGIGFLAFANCSSLTGITIPDSVTSIKFHAFDRCANLTSVTFQGTISSDNFDKTAFSNTQSEIKSNDLPEKYFSDSGGTGTYIRFPEGKIWRKQ